MIGSTEFKLASEVVQQKAEESLEELKKGLGDAAKDPEVEKILKEGAAKIKNGEPLGDAWSDKLKDAVNAAGGDPATQLPPGTDPANLDNIANDIQGLSEANAILSQPFPSGGLGVFVPSGPTDVILFPALPQDDLVVLPDGSIMVGTGGDGMIDVVNVDAADLLGVPVGIGDPEPDSTADVAKRAKDGVLLMNPAENGVTVGYVVSNHDYSMKAGYTQQLAAGRTWEIRFDRGEGNGEAKYTLKGGTYAFGTSSNGWELYRKTFNVTIDNSENESPFRYVVDNTSHEVAAGGSKKHTSDYPILVRFDRGDGKDEAKKKISEKNYELKVAVNSADGLWDLYPSIGHPSIASLGLPQAAEDHKAPVATGRALRLRSLLQAAGR